MLVLVVDSATPAVTAALVEIEQHTVAAVAQRVSVDAQRHGELLAPEVAAVLAEGGARPRNLAAVVAGLGPGPFTGLRVGLVTAAAFGDALGIPTYGVCSLDGLGAATIGRTLVATDARRREIYWGVYDESARVTGPAVDRPADVARQLAALGVSRAVGDGALRYADGLGVPVDAEPRYPSAVALAGLAADRVRDGAPGERLTPVYLRRPDAVEPGARKPVLP
ncbi:MAG TPA: tRNA (adenosine(37)-N6)-threonylcarbamoyltransferase complex dimerization subunit type 1 TsaB [Micromonosporaceae bacterium]|nr:tRNA (adenosine(37)-N6)-threonylcarbamoyltransferase complex dimerization subunit type 1 TsaB [Micromonosporaceae bacterium]